jgi:hypothetical protein
MCASDGTKEIRSISNLDTRGFSVCGVGLYGDLKKFTRGFDVEVAGERGSTPGWLAGLRPLLAA